MGKRRVLLGIFQRRVFFLQSLWGAIEMEEQYLQIMIIGQN